MEFGTETLRYCLDESKVSGHFGTSTEVPERYFRPKYRTVQSHDHNYVLKCPTVWSKMFHPNFVVYVAYRPTSLSQPRMPFATV